MVAAFYRAYAVRMFVPAGHGAVAVLFQRLAAVYAGVGVLLLCERTPAYRGGSFLLQRDSATDSKELRRLTLSPQA